MSWHLTLVNAAISRLDVSNFQSPILENHKIKHFFITQRSDKKSQITNNGQSIKNPFAQYESSLIFPHWNNHLHCLLIFSITPSIHYNSCALHFSLWHAPLLYYIFCSLLFPRKDTSILRKTKGLFILAFWGRKSRTKRRRKQTVRGFLLLFLCIYSRKNMRKKKVEHPKRKLLFHTFL